ncbi:MAG: hypothetical protein A2464_13880 [Deltaproteobacteria bacterium RIFOXYC2_FULL_48_10]|nr:MAG: hypothetical protein A2464_13880 [Deltaproteobacteria bacterium RIFOXYC2_FULL_48_10]
MEDFQQENKSNVDKYHMDKKRVKKNISISGWPGTILVSLSYRSTKIPGISQQGRLFSCHGTESSSIIKNHHFHISLKYKETI